MSAGLHISISAEPLAYIGDLAITNSIFTSLLVSGTLISMAIVANSQIKTTGRPGGLQNLLEMIVEGLHNLTQDITHSKAKTKLIFPVTASFFLFIVLNNWLGLLPGVGTIGIDHHPEPQEHSLKLAPQAMAVDDTGEEVMVEEHEDELVDSHGADEVHAEEGVHEEDGHKDGHEVFIPILRAGSADLNTTIALAIFSMVYVQFLGFKFLGVSYLTKFFSLKSPIFAFVGLLELISEFAKIISFAFRLFGNIFAGEVLLAVIAFLLPIGAPIPFLFLEVMVGAIQALVFAMLSMVFMTMATEGHGDDH